MAASDYAPTSIYRLRFQGRPQMLFCAGPVLIPASAALARARRDADGWTR